jgi:hypothetical protein
MDLSTVGTVFKDIATGLLGIGVGLTVLTLAMGGIAMYFSWMDTHIGGLIKKILISSLGGGAMLGMSGALGLWLGGKFGLT